MSQGRLDSSGSPGQDPRSAKERILDAAEELFARGGYTGVSLREITQLAGVEVALANYHFGPKEELFRHVVSRRAEEHCAGVINALDEAIAASPDAPPTVEDIVRAFCRYTFERSGRGGPGWKRYFQLLSRSALLPVYEPILAPLNKPYGAVVRRYVAALQASLPTCSEAGIYAGFHYLQAVVGHLLAETGTVDRQSRGLVRADDFDGHLARLVPFIAAGFYALASRRDQA